MRKKFLLFTIFIASFVNAQKETKEKLFKEVTVGAIFGTFASHSFSGDEKPFLLEYNLYADISIDTKKTFHEFLYGFGNNSLYMVNGYFLKNNWDIYSIYSKILDNHSNFLGLGIEKGLIGENINYFLLTEISTDFEDETVLSFGLLIKINYKLSKKE